MIFIIINDLTKRNVCVYGVFNNWVEDDYGITQIKIIKFILPLSFDGSCQS